jgi:hypothetical protein
MQTPSQPSIGAMQLHSPIAQLVPAGQTLPQLPQLFESPTTRVHTPLQLMVPVPQLTFVSVNVSGTETRPSMSTLPASPSPLRTVQEALVASTEASARGTQRELRSMEGLFRRKIEIKESV